LESQVNASSHSYKKIKRERGRKEGLSFSQADESRCEDRRKGNGKTRRMEGRMKKGIVVESRSYAESTETRLSTELKKTRGPARHGRRCWVLLKRGEAGRGGRSCRRPHRRNIPARDGISRRPIKTNVKTIRRKAKKRCQKKNRKRKRDR